MIDFQHGLQKLKTIGKGKEKLFFHFQIMGATAIFLHLDFQKENAQAFP